MWNRFLIVMGIEVAAYLYKAGRCVLEKGAGIDGQGPWQGEQSREPVPEMCPC